MEALFALRSASGATPTHACTTRTQTRVSDRCAHARSLARTMHHTRRRRQTRRERDAAGGPWRHSKQKGAGSRGQRRHRRHTTDNTHRRHIRHTETAYAEGRALSTTRPVQCTVRSQAGSVMWYVMPCHTPRGPICQGPQARQPPTAPLPPQSARLLKPLPSLDGCRLSALRLSRSNQLSDAATQD